MARLDDLQFSVIQTALGWMAFAGRDEKLFGLSFGHKTADGASKRVTRELVASAQVADWFPRLRQRLEDYADGAPDEFLDIDVECNVTTPFAVAVIKACRRIGYGETLSYGELADQVGAPRAARAVGNVMRTNRCPLVIPCHRVVHGDGRIGGFSAPQGASMKERLLAMEAGSRLLAQR